MTLIELMDSPIAFHRAYFTITGSMNAAILLSQFVYWHNRSPHEGQKFYNTQEDITVDIGLTRSEQESARKLLRDKGFLTEEYERLAHRMWYKVNPEAIMEAVLAADHPMRKSSIPQCRNPAVGSAGILRSSICTETPSETPPLRKPESKEPPVAVFKKVRARNEYFDELVRVCGIDEEGARVSGSSIAKCANELKGVGVRVEDIAKVAGFHRKEWPTCTVTPTSIVKNWGVLMVAGNAKKKLAPTM